MSSALAILRQRAREYELEKDREWGVTPLPLAREGCLEEELWKTDTPAGEVHVRVSDHGKTDPADTKNETADDHHITSFAALVSRWGKVEDVDLNITEAFEKHLLQKQQSWQQTNKKSKPCGAHQQKPVGDHASSPATDLNEEYSFTNSSRYVSYMGAGSRLKKREKTMAAESAVSSCSDSCLSSSFLTDVCMPVAKLVTAISMRLAKETVKNQGDSEIGQTGSAGAGRAETRANCSSVTEDSDEEAANSGKQMSKLTAKEARLLQLYRSCILPIAVKIRRNKTLAGSHSAEPNHPQEEEEKHLARLIVSNDDNNNTNMSVQQSGHRHEVGDDEDEDDTRLDSSEHMAFFCVLQPIFAGVESFVKMTAFHVSSAATRSDQTYPQKARRVFNLVADQMPLVGKFAQHFNPYKNTETAASQRGGDDEQQQRYDCGKIVDGSSVAVWAYSLAIDALLSINLVSPAAADPLGVGLLGVFDAFGQYASAILANPPLGFLLAPPPTLPSTSKTRTSRQHADEPRLILPGTAAVLGFGSGEVILRAKEAAIGRVTSLLMCEDSHSTPKFSEGFGAVERGVSVAAIGNTVSSALVSQKPPPAVVALEMNKAPWRHKHLVDGYSLPLPAHCVSQAGRVVASFSKTLRSLELIALAINGRPRAEEDEIHNSKHGSINKGPSTWLIPTPQSIAQIGGGFVVRSLALLAEHLNQRLEYLFELDEELSLVKQVEDHLQIHLDMDAAVSWGEEWVELFEDELMRQEGIQTLDSILLDRDRCLRSLSSIIVLLADDIKRRTDGGDSVGHQCQLVKSYLRNVHRMYGEQSVWAVANKAAAVKITHNLKKKGSAVESDADIALILSALAGSK